MMNALCLFPCLFFLLGSRAIEGAAGIIGSSKDPSSYSNVDQFMPSHMSFDIAISFDDSSISGTVTHTLIVLESNVTTVYLDVWDGLTLSMAEVKTGDDDFVEVPFDITTPNVNIGNALAVTLPDELVNGTELFLRFTYATTVDSYAVSWMTPAQTAGKKLPFLYSLCQMNYCRDFAPMMDTPSMKITYDASVTSPKEFLVAMSANETGVIEVNSTHKITMFNCTVKIPSYLIAILAGDLEVKSLSDRVRVMSEPSLLDAAVEEFVDLVQAMDVVETYLTPYIWGNYTIVFMPPSFTWGGMEHPMITFASPTLISGDKSQVNVAFHELTHSWFGNNVGCQNWDNFWLNEGLNTFMERKVTSIIYGINFTKIEYFTGNTTMYEDMLDYGLDNLYSSLFPNIRMDDPENSFSNIIYEKGSQFVYYIESLIGEDKMQVLLRLYINTFAQSAIESTDFKALYETFVMDNFDTNTSSDVILKTDWDTWIYKPGLPPVLQDFTTDELAEALALAQSYAELGGQSSPANFQDFFVFFTSQKIAFIDELNYIDSVDADLLAYIDSDLNLLSINSPPVKNKWYELGISKGYDAVMDPTYTWMGEQGRNKYVIPIFQSLVDAGHCDMGKAWFKDYQSFYNSYVVSGVERILKPCDVVVAPIPMPSLSPTAMPATTPTSSAGGSAALSAVWSATMIVLLIICISS